MVRQRMPSDSKSPLTSGVIRSERQNHLAPGVHRTDPELRSSDVWAGWLERPCLEDKPLVQPHRSTLAADLGRLDDEVGRINGERAVAGDFRKIRESSGGKRRNHPWALAGEEQQ